MASNRFKTEVDVSRFQSFFNNHVKVPSTFNSRILILSIIIMIIISNNIWKISDANASDLNSGVYSTDSKPYGIPYVDWLTKWSKWFISIPVDTNPREHFSPDNCATDQIGPVWFLTDTLKGDETRSCKISSDKSILLPILSGTCWGDKTTPMSDEDVVKCVTEGNEYGVITATVDGIPIKELKSYRTQTPFFNLTVPENNVFMAAAGVWKAKTDGFFLFLEPMAPGNHTVKTTTTVFNPIAPQYNYAASLTYNLKITP